MKKSIIALTLASLCGATSAHADTILGLYVGVQGWDMDTDGGFASSPSLTDFAFDSETKSNFYVALEHPIPLIPNVKVQRTNMDTSGNVALNANFEFGGELFNVNSNVFTDVEMTSTDVVLYYELFDNDLLSFDFGLNGKYIDGDLFVQSNDDASLNAAESLSGVIPMLYSKVQVGLPFTGWSAFAEGNYLAFDDSTITDYQVAITYTFVDNLAVDMTAQLGYRSLEVELDDLDGIYSDLEFSGVFAGLEVHF